MPTVARSTHRSGSVATDGKFGFRVSGVNTAARIKRKGGTSLAEGKFVKVWLAVTNRASKARFVSADTSSSTRAAGPTR